jgi:ribose/xylose/arabinose/galactoside ABC-type transport system permease subunit
MPGTSRGCDLSRAETATGTTSGGSRILGASGAINLSVGSVVALVSVTVGQLMVTAGLPPVLATIGALVVGALVGVFNGAVVAYTRIPSFVVTLGMLAMASGLALGITQGQTISGFPQGFLVIGQGSTLGVPNPVWPAAVAAVVAQLVLARTTFGRHVYLLGSNEQAALLSGIAAPHEDPHLHGRVHSRGVRGDRRDGPADRRAALGWRGLRARRDRCGRHRRGQPVRR